MILTDASGGATAGLTSRTIATLVSAGSEGTVHAGGAAAAVATTAFAFVAAAAAAAAATTAAAAALSSFRCGGPSVERSPLRSVAGGSRERSRLRERPRDLCRRERPPPRSLERDRDCDRRFERFGDAEDERFRRGRDLCRALVAPDGVRERVRRRLERPGDVDRDRSLGFEPDRRLDLERDERCRDLERDRCLDLERDRCLDLERNRCRDLERNRCLDLERDLRDSRSRPLPDFFASP